MKSFQSIRGMNDILPQATAAWEAVESILHTIAAGYGYREIRFPILEPTELFIRTIGDATDIVTKEMYTFMDRNNDSITLRPEGTASCVRAGIQHGLLHNQIQRFWYMGPMFRHERPQKGRLRQFHQFGIEAFGLAGPDIDAEILLLCARIFSMLKIQNKIVLQLNTIGNSDDRKRYREALLNYFSAHEEFLDEESKMRLTRNPLRILDSKNPEIIKLVQKAPKLLDYVSKDARTHFDQLCEMLNWLKIKFAVNPYLIRGLDYYNYTVFEWVTDCLGAQGTVCAGGHYDSLVEQLGGKSTPAIGFALGLERLLELVDATVYNDKAPHVYVVSLNSTLALEMAEKIRDAVSGWRVVVNCGEGDLRAQLRRADKSGALLALIVDDNQNVTLKFLREQMAEQKLSINDAINKIKAMNISDYSGMVSSISQDAQL